MNELEPKNHTYKIKGETEFLSHISKLVYFLSTIKEIRPTSIKTNVCYGICKFKFKGTEAQLRDLISSLSNSGFKIKKIRKVLF